MAKNKKSPRKFVGGGSDMGDAMARLGQMRNDMLVAQKEVSESVVEGKSSNSLVKITMNGSSELLSLHFDDSLLVSGNSEILEALVLEATSDATEKIKLITEEKMGAYAAMIKGL